ncbi:hypothetical protein AX17_000096 [Amanita inopinata Kibby_2008]|nr:hypothetical protein AX17_000096 [Amanita inopinata Kibby_2008]
MTLPFLTSLLAPLSPPPQSRPLLTLTFAQSLDAKIAGAHSQQLILSGNDSMLMTHHLRTLHDAILVGIGTALNDNPQLNTRRLPPEERRHLPKPIVLDSRLRLPPSCKLLLNYQAGLGRRPYLFAADTHAGHPDWQSRRTLLEEAGAKIITVPSSPDGLLHFPTILKVLRDLHIRSLMVEGGARVISSMFASYSDLIDTIIVTVAPVFVGDQGVAYHGLSNQQSRFHHAATEVMGKDTVIALSAHSL